MSACLATVLIPTYNRPNHLAEVLAALEAQAERETPFRVIVVDDGSAPPATIPRTGLDVQLVALPANRGRAAARNAGLDAVETPLVIFLDDDMRPQAGFVRAYVRSVDPDGDRVGIGTVTFDRHIPRERLTQYLETRGVAKLRPDETIPFKYFLTYNSAVPTRLLKGAGGFDQRIRHWGGEDLELAWRLVGHGAEFVRVADAVALHAHRRSLDDVWDVSVQFAEKSLPTVLAAHPELVSEMRADVLGPARYAGGLTMRRLVVRACTRRPLGRLARAIASAFPSFPWPMSLFDYIIVSAWREGLDRSTTGARAGETSG